MQLTAATVFHLLLHHCLQITIIQTEGNFLEEQFGCRSDKFRGTSRQTAPRSAVARRLVIWTRGKKKEEKVIVSSRPDDVSFPLWDSPAGRASLTVISTHNRIAPPIDISPSEDKSNLLTVSHLLMKLWPHDNIRRKRNGENEEISLSSLLNPSNKCSLRNIATVHKTQLTEGLRLREW